MPDAVQHFVINTTYWNSYEILVEYALMKLLLPLNIPLYGVETYSEIP